MSQAGTVSPCISLVAPARRSEILSCVLEDLGAVAVEVRDGTTMSGHPGDAVLLIAGFCGSPERDEALARLAAEEGVVEATAVDVADDGWSRGWRAFFQPVVLERIQVITPWMEAPRDDLMTIVIDPGLAFGTGGHPTTRLVLGMLERRAASARLPASTIDIGVGSGVLSIAAVKLGTGRALGIDIDEESMGSVAQNARANGVSHLVEARVAGPEEISGQWPLLLANIELAVFERHARHLAPLVAPGGEALLSGLLEDQVDRCVSLWPGFVAEEVVADAGWAAIALRRQK